MDDIRRPWTQAADRGARKVDVCIYLCNASPKPLPQTPPLPVEVLVGGRVMRQPRYVGCSMADIPLALAKLLTWRDRQINALSLLLDDDEVSPPSTRLLATVTCTRHLVQPTAPSQPFLFPMSSLSPLPPTPTMTQNLTTLYGLPYLVVVRAFYVSDWHIY
ncbi:uncharacterized protein ARMOST_18791 [Armillaria ostoyae]|uniref:Uncharacterized protein n=1 Tax=Armillaria ostoyae TaxID=47428 RepID=A0A284S2R2_ARMOS|nr:uncharacterized protein ARMOST_18791 [Armillaria ostoyae]